MGQKVNPHGARVGVIFGWSGRWYAGKKDFANYLVEDNKLRKMIKNDYYDCGISHIDIERTAQNVLMDLFKTTFGGVYSYSLEGLLLFVLFDDRAEGEFLLFIDGDDTVEPDSLEKIDRVGDGSFEIIGAQSPAKVADPATVTRQETANGGAWALTLQSTEVYAETVFFDTDYATTLAAFEALLANAF